jgi:hypothetical protein
MSTGLATYPVPPQRGQSFGSTHPPSVAKEFFTNSRSQCHKVNPVTKREHVRIADLPIRVQANGPFEDQEIDVRSWDGKPYVPQ